MTATPTTSGSEPRLTVGRDLAGWFAVLTLWLGISDWLLAATPPPARGTWLGAAALLWVSLLIVGFAFWSGWARPRFRRWSGAAVSTGAILVLVTSRVVWFAIGGWVEVVAVVITVPLVIGVALIALGRLRRSPGWALPALIASALFALLLCAGVPQAVPSLRWRINTFGTGNWAARSEDLLDRAPPRSSLTTGHPTVVERGGASAVGSLRPGPRGRRLTDEGRPALGHRHAALQL